MTIKTTTRTRVYALTVSGRIAEYCAAPLPHKTLAEWRDRVPEFYFQTVLNSDDERSPDLHDCRDFPHSHYFEGAVVENGLLTVSDHVTGRDYEIDLSDPDHRLDWDDLVEKNETDAFGLRQHCALFEMPYSGELQYEIRTRAAFNPDKLMFVASRFSDGPWFVSEIYYEGRRLENGGGTGTYDFNKVSLLDFSNNIGNFVGYFRGNP